MKKPLLLLVALLWGPTIARADFQYDLILDQASYSATVGDSIAVGLTLRQTNINGGAQSTTDNLSSWNLGIAHGGEVLGTTFSDGLGAGGIPNALPGAASFRVSYIDLSAPYAPATVSAGGDVKEWDLGTFNFSAATAGAGNFVAETFVTTDLNFTGTGVDLDALPAGSTVNFGSASYTVAVPEPSSFALLGVCGAGFVLRRRRS